MCILDFLGDIASIGTVAVTGYIAYQARDFFFKEQSVLEAQREQKDKLSAYKHFAHIKDKEQREEALFSYLRYGGLSEADVFEIAERALIDSAMSLDDRVRQMNAWREKWDTRKDIPLYTNKKD